MGDEIRIDCEIERLIFDSEKIRNVAISQGDNEVTKAFARYAVGKYEPTYSSIFDEKIMGPKTDFFLQSVIEKHCNNNYLINLIDTPSLTGSNNFMGSIRVVDGIVIVVSARGVSESVEIVLSKTLRYGIKPIIFINDLEHPINDLKSNPDELHERLNRIVRNVNELIGIYAPLDRKQEWQVDLNDGSVMFGSIYKNLAFDIAFMNEKGIDFKDIPDYFNEDNIQHLSKSPIFSVLNRQIVEHLPSAKDAQTYRISKMWKDNLESDEGQAMVHTSSEGPLSAMMIKNALYNIPFAICRVYGGTLKKGDEIHLAESEEKFCIESVEFNISPKGLIREIDELPAGNIAYIRNVKNAGFATACLRENKITEFKEAEKDDNGSEIIAAYIDLANHDEYRVRNCLAYIDQVKDIRTELDYESRKMTLYFSDADFLLHLCKIIEDRYGINISRLQTIYKESISSKADNIKVITPNKQNILNFEIEPLNSCIECGLKDSDFETYEILKNHLSDEELKEIDVKNKEMGEKEANTALCLHNNNIILNIAKDDTDLNEANNQIIMVACRQALDDGPLASQEMSGVKIKLVNAKFHENPIHRGPAQLIPSIKNALNDAFKLADPYLIEPILKGHISTLTKYIEDCSNEIKNRRGIIVNQELRDDFCEMDFELPVAEIFGFEKSFELINEGEGFLSVEFKDYRKLPDNLQEDVANHQP